MPGEKTIFARNTSFFSTLKSKLHVKQSSSRLSEQDDHLLQSLDINLTLSFETLRNSSKLELWSLQCLRQLMAAVLETSLFLQKMLPATMHAPLTRKDEKLLNNFLDSNAKYLDACNAVREGIGSIEHIQMYVKSTVHIFEASKGGLSEPQLIRTRKSLNECFSMLGNDQSHRQISIALCSLQTVSDKLFPPKNSEASSLLQAFAMAEYSTNVISLFALGMSLAAFLPGENTHIVEILNMSRHYSTWSLQLLSLQEEVKQSAATKKCSQHGLFSEFDTFKVCLNRVSIIVESATTSRTYPMSAQQEQQFTRAVEDLRHISQDLDDGLRAMDHTISKLFQQLISSRNAVLDLFSLAMR